MPPTSNRSYRVKKSDNALTLPGRVTFPQGSYVSSPTPNNIFAPAVAAGGYGTPPRTPYAMGTGTQASGLAGNQGASSAMLPTNQYLGQGTYLNSQPRTTYNQPNAAYNNPQRGRGTNANYGTPAMGFGTNPSEAAYNQANPAGLITQTGAGSTVPLGGRVYGAHDALGQAAPYGVNSYGERLSASGDVWDPKTATTDIYGGRFIQVGETRWERNAKGRLVKVQYGKGGKKNIISGGKNQSANRNKAPQQQRPDQAGEAASMFVSFRA